ncbi:MAG: hypothetical protein WBF79_14880 [Rhodococcus sp. (in: high G+C Gram-positive bacteria)]
MTGLTDGSNFGARDTSGQRFYGSSLSGRGRWARVPGIGILWTDNQDSLQWAHADDSDSAQLYAACKALHGLAAEGVPAPVAFEDLVAGYGVTPVTGNLRSMPRQ